ncbi:MAG: MBOAT family protein [Oscillospiraceae bacterium]|jgi:alginate O-acetyltransferase complex protein AlgI|nr:MBOAT family protein [Oscillospiraceae bacterium]
MVFADLFFLYGFLPVCLLIYFAASGISMKNAVLTVASLLFYAWGEPFWVLLLLFSALFSYFGTLYVEYYKNTKQEKLVFVITLIGTLAPLIGFKYTGFIVENINLLPLVNIPVPDISLPVGISFYTFQALSYVIDCYWGKLKPSTSFKEYLLYICLFPSLVAGPIVRYETVAEQIKHRSSTIDDVSYGLSRVAIGLAKKVIIANNLSTIVASIFSGDISSVSVLGTWTGAAIFALQVYFDFSGYSDIAIGLARVFGFKLNENFNYPFLSKDVQEFWQRWHISLGSFFKDYLLYLPIFGKRRKYGGLLLVWLCTGLWHGASWNFIIWGLFFGAFIMLEVKIGKKVMKKIPKLIKHIYTKAVLIIGFGIFYFENNKELWDFIKNLFGLNDNKKTDIMLNTLLYNNMFLLIGAVLFSMPIYRIIQTKYNEAKAFNVVQTVINVVLILVSSIMLVGATNNAFLYYRF